MRERAVRAAPAPPASRFGRPDAGAARARASLRGPSRGERLRFLAIAGTAAVAAVAWPVFAALVNRHWYAGLLKPFFAPAPWIAVLMLGGVAAAAGAALFRTFCRPDYHPDRVRAIGTLLTAIAVADAWAWAFFVGRHPTLSLAFAAALVVVSGLAVWRAAAVERQAALLLLPWSLAAVLVALVDLSVRLRNG